MSSMNNPQSLDAMKQLLINTFSPSILEVVDHSERHRHHREMQGTDHGSNKITHVKISMAAADLKDLSPIDRHRRIFDCLEKAGWSLHSISISII